MQKWTGSRLALAVALAALGVTLNGSPASANSLFVKARVPQRSTFVTEMELQGIYDEISEISVPALTAEDMSTLLDVVYTPDWVLVDSAGRRLSLADLSARDATSPEPDAVIERIERVLPGAGFVTTHIAAISVHSFVDTTGRYGPPGATHTLTEITPYRDRWVRISGEWRMKSREQAGRTKTALDKPEWGM
jgi:hypothetical protein